MAVPRYFASLDDIIDALLLDDSDRAGEQNKQAYKDGDSERHSPSVNSDSATWFGASVESAVSLIVSELSLKQIGQQMPDSPIRKDLIARVDASIAEFLDQYCGNTGHSALFPWPGPPPWILPTVSRLSTIASTMQDQDLKDSVLNVAATMAMKSFSCSAHTEAT